MQRTDHELIAAARTGDGDALEELLERHQPRVYRFGMKMCGDREDAQDVLQETLLAMARGVHDFRGASSISTWLYTIARSFCIKKRRKSRFAPERHDSIDASEDVATVEVADSARGPDEEVAGKQVQAALDQAIATLDPDSREVLILRDMEGLTAPEVAEVLGTSTQAVKSRLHRARRSVRDRVAPMLGIPIDLPTAAVPCPDILTLFSQHLEDEIGPDVCAAMERHLEDCPRCRATCDSLKRTLALCRTTDADIAVPAAIQEAVRTALRGLSSRAR
jgi:RNA polymerase sigma-70 factor (ECF subfamily)